MKRFRFTGQVMGLPMRSRPTAAAGRGQPARYCNKRRSQASSELIDMASIDRFI